VAAVAVAWWRQWRLATVSVVLPGLG